tara:strand:- start:290 stop:418 length:129 start_codon:yes stop_codon:yes gene_type:complete
VAVEVDLTLVPEDLAHLVVLLVEMLQPLVHLLLDQHTQEYQM